MTPAQGRACADGGGRARYLTTTGHTYRVPSSSGTLPSALLPRQKTNLRHRESEEPSQGLTAVRGAEPEPWPRGRVRHLHSRLNGTPTTGGPSRPPFLSSAPRELCVWIEAPLVGSWGAVSAGRPRALRAPAPRPGCVATAGRRGPRRRTGPRRVHLRPRLCRGPPASLGSPAVSCKGHV